MDRIKEKSWLFLLFLTFPVFVLFWRIGQVPNDYYYEINGEEMHSMVLLDAIKRNIPLDQAVREYANKIWTVPYKGIEWDKPWITGAIDQVFNWPLTYDIFFIKNLISRHHTSTFIFQSLIAFLSVLLLYFIAKIMYNREVAVYTVLFTSTSFGFLVYVRNGNISILINYMFVLIAYLVTLIALKVNIKSRIILYIVGISIASIFLCGYYSAWPYIQILFALFILIYISTSLSKKIRKEIVLADVKRPIYIKDVLLVGLSCCSFFFLYIYIHGLIFNAGFKEMINHFLISFPNLQFTIKGNLKNTQILKQLLVDFLPNILGTRISHGYDHPHQILIGKPIMYIFTKIFFAMGFLWILWPKRLRRLDNFLIIITILIPFTALLFYNGRFTMRRFIIPLMFINLIAGIGLYRTRMWIYAWNKEIPKRIFIIFIATFFIINWGRTWYDYFISFPKQVEVQFDQKAFGYRQTAQYLKDNFDLSKAGIIYENTVFIFTHRNSLICILWDYRDSVVMLDAKRPVTAKDLKKLVKECFSDKEKIIYIFEKDSKNIPLIYKINPDIHPLYHPYSLNVYVDDIKA